MARSVRRNALPQKLRRSRSVPHEDTPAIRDSLAFQRARDRVSAFLQTMPRDYLDVRRRESSLPLPKLLVSMVLGCSVNRNRADLQRHPGKPSQAMADTIDGMSDGIDGMGGCHRWY